MNIWTLREVISGEIRSISKKKRPVKKYRSFLFYVLPNEKKCGNILMLLVWRNGRRSRLKICHRQLCAGSSPATSTKALVSVLFLF